VAKFQVTIIKIIEFESDSAENARYDVENGEIPRSNEIIDEWISEVTEVPNG